MYFYSCRDWLGYLKPRCASASEFNHGNSRLAALTPDSKLCCSIRDRIIQTPMVSQIRSTNMF